jgi:hypothetical protein
MPGVLVDATGVAPIPATPRSNLNKGQKMKVRTQKAIRKTRRVVLRKSVLFVLLGRQVASPAVDALKLISKRGSGTVDAAISTSLVPAPMLM